MVKVLLAALWLSGCGTMNHWIFEKTMCRTDFDVMGWTICGPSLHDPDAVRE